MQRIIIPISVMATTGKVTDTQGHSKGLDGLFQVVVPMSKFLWW